MRCVRGNGRGRVSWDGQGSTGSWQAGREKTREELPSLIWPAIGTQAELGIKGDRPEQRLTGDYPYGPEEQQEQIGCGLGRPTQHTHTLSLYLSVYHTTATAHAAHAEHPHDSTQYLTKIAQPTGLHGYNGDGVCVTVWSRFL